MSSPKDDTATVVLDFDAIKQELANDEILTDDDELLFSATETAKIKHPVFLFDYESDFFQKKELEKIDKKISRLTTLAQLNKVLTKTPKSIIVFYYNGSPKVVNQLCSQIKSKFLKTKTLIVAKGLSAKKASLHHQSKYGADSYLKEPFEELQFLQTIEKIDL